MLGSLVKRERRPLWAAISVLLLFAIGTAVFMGARARSNATVEAAEDAELTAQTELAPLLLPRDLMAPIVGERATDLGGQIETTITSSGDVDRVRIYSSLGRILYATEPDIVGTRPSYLRDLTFEVVNGDTQTQVHSGLLQTYVPIWLSPEGAVVVAEMSQPYGPIAAEASGTWNQLALACGVLLLGGIAMIVKTSLSRAPAKTSVQVYAPQAPVRLPKDLLAPAADAPIYQQAGFRVVEEQRMAAEARAKAAEENYRSVQQQLKATLAQMKELEGRLAMQESQTTTSDTELQALRDQLRDTAERLHKADIDNNQLRERMALRQRELEEARHQVASIRAEGSDAEELKQRLVAAERRAGELARQAERLESELDYTKSKLHMTKLSEALREFDNDEIDIEVGADEDDLFEHPVIIRGNGLASHGKVR
jgi:hypothetical protein